ncbi:MAG: hypothetical protein R6T83_10470, partial [Salinibacter sp.]
MSSPSDTNGIPLDSEPPAIAALADPWARRPLVLNGPLERTSVDAATLGFVTGLLGLGAAFVLFQFFITPIVLVVQIVLAEGGMSSLGAMNDPDQNRPTDKEEKWVINETAMKKFQIPPDS